MIDFHALGRAYINSGPYKCAPFTLDCRQARHKLYKPIGSYVGIYTDKYIGTYIGNYIGHDTEKT